MYRKDVRLLAEPPVGYVLVGRMITEAPVEEESGIEVPSPEKYLVDVICRKEMDQLAFQRMMEVYAINEDRLRRYASRRGVREELATCLSRLDQSRIDMFGRIQRYFAHTQINRAWVFGSFARGEETVSSDVDILISLAPGTTMGLAYFRMIVDLGEKNSSGRLTLSLKGISSPLPASPLIGIKYLVYERAS